jgi:hypothetical protein
MKILPVWVHFFRVEERTDGQDGTEVRLSQFYQRP